MPTFKEYRNFCYKVSHTGVTHYTVESAISNLSVLNNQQFIIIKHDVESAPKKALEISKIEHGFGIKATYYVHSFFLHNPSNVVIFKEIQDLGHEIGYHFDVLDSNDGDMRQAIKEFGDALSLFAKNGFNVKTVCPHGNPLKKREGYSGNKDFFLDKEVWAKFQSVVDVYITFPNMVDRNYLYVTDAKYSYMYRNTRVMMTDTSEGYIPLDGGDDIIRLIQDGYSLIISIHTHRYFHFAIVNSMRLVSYKIAKRIAEIMYETRLGKRLIDRFYFIAKKI